MIERPLAGGFEPSLPDWAGVPATLEERRIRVGIMCEGTVFPAWMADAIVELAALDGVEIALLILDGRIVAPAPPVSPAGAGGPAITRLLARGAAGARSFMRSSMWLKYQYLASRLSPQPMDRKVDLGELLAAVPRIACVPRLAGKFSQYFAPDDVERIRGHRLDLILRFAFGIIRGEILAAAAQGVWSFHHDDPRQVRGGPPGFWEMFRREPYNGAILQRLTDRLDDGLLLFEDRFPTRMHSYVEHLNALYVGSAPWPARVCMSVQLGRPDGTQSAPIRSQAPISKAPSGGEMARFLARTALAALARAASGTSDASRAREARAIAIVPAGLPEWIHATAMPPVQWLELPGGRSARTPFAVRRGDVTTVLFEDHDDASGRGRIACFDRSADGALSAARTVFEAAHRVSYPYVFEHGGAVYCVPAEPDSRQLHLYELRAFPDHWVRRATLLEGVCVTRPTLVRAGGVFWLLVEVTEPARAGSLRRFSAESIDGPWRPHPSNGEGGAPVAMSAGRPFLSHTSLLRPVKRPGDPALSLFETTSLLPERFAERFIGRILPSAAWPFALGIECMSAVRGLTVLECTGRARNAGRP